MRRAQVCAIHLAAFVSLSAQAANGHKNRHPPPDEGDAAQSQEALDGAGFDPGGMAQVPPTRALVFKVHPSKPWLILKLAKDLPARAKIGEIIGIKPAESSGDWYLVTVRKASARKIMVAFAEIPEGFERGSKLLVASSQALSNDADYAHDTATIVRRDKRKKRLHVVLAAGVKPPNAGDSVDITLWPSGEQASVQVASVENGTLILDAESSPDSIVSGTDRGLELMPGSAGIRPWSIPSGGGYLALLDQSRVDAGIQQVALTDSIDRTSAKRGGARFSVKPALSFGPRRGGASLAVSSTSGKSQADDSASLKELNARFDALFALELGFGFGLAADYSDGTLKAGNLSLETKLTRVSPELAWLGHSTRTVFTYTPKGKAKETLKIAGLGTSQNQDIDLPSEIELALASGMTPRFGFAGIFAYNLDDVKDESREKLKINEAASFTAGGVLAVGAGWQLDLGLARNRSALGNNFGYLTSTTPRFGGYLTIAKQFGAFDLRLTAEALQGAVSRATPPESGSAGAGSGGSAGTEATVEKIKSTEVGLFFGHGF